MAKRTKGIVIEGKGTNEENNTGNQLSSGYELKRYIKSITYFSLKRGTKYKHKTATSTTSRLVMHSKTLRTFSVIL